MNSFTSLDYTTRVVCLCACLTGTAFGHDNENALAKIKPNPIPLPDIQIAQLVDTIRSMYIQLPKLIDQSLATKQKLNDVARWNRAHELYQNFVTQTERSINSILLLNSGYSGHRLQKICAFACLSYFDKINDSGSYTFYGDRYGVHQSIVLTSMDSAEINHSLFLLTHFIISDHMGISSDVSSFKKSYRAHEKKRKKKPDLTNPLAEAHTTVVLFQRIAKLRLAVLD